MKKFIKEIPTLRKNYHPIEVAAMIHQKLVDIHPFVDGNGRTARLLMNLVLFQNGYTISIIPPMLRSDYISLIKKSQTGTKDNSAFINFISSMVYESSKDYLRLLKELHKK